MRRLFTLLLVAMACTATYWACAGQDEKPSESVWMKKKLDYSKDILEGITTENFESVQRAATAMQRLSELEGFVRRKDTKAYRTQLAAFEFANEELLRQADKRNIDGATLAFTQLTLSCVNCHKQLRLP